MIAVILAGGSGQRLGGRCKAMLRLRDQGTILSHLQACCRTAGITDLVVNANDPAPFAGCGLPIIADRRAGAGPTAGIETALLYAAEHGADAVLLLASDLPAMTATVVRALMAGWHASRRPQVAWTRQPEVHPHPLCACVGVEAGPEISIALDAGERAVHRLWTRLGAQQVWFEDDAAFINLNTPEDLARWTASASS